MKLIFNINFWADNYLFVFAMAISFIIVVVFKLVRNRAKNSHVKNDINNILNVFSLRTIIDNHIFSSNLKDVDFNKKQIINTINPHSFCVSQKDLQFKKALINSDILLPDGFGIVLASKILSGKSIKKIAGADIHNHLLAHANLNNMRVFYLGASQDTLDQISRKIDKNFPNIKVSNYSPPYKSKFSRQDSESMISCVNAFNPDILFVGMTAPKQEKWVYENRNKLNSTTTVSIGAVFDFYAGTVKRPSSFWINIGLEWLPRLIKEPKRLWRRNFISMPLFLLSIGKAKLKA